MDNTTNTTPVTLESIAQKKAMLLQEIRLQKEIMTGLTQEIFAPLEPATNKANAMMRAFNTGMAVFDGIVLGVKVMKKFRKIFGGIIYHMRRFPLLRMLSDLWTFSI